MAEFSAHVRQARLNLDFLAELNTIPEKWDWKVTIGFYVVVHLVNAHTAEQARMHYRTHKSVEDAISPFSKIDSLRLDDNTFSSYMAIKNLSRRARYLCTDDGSRPEAALLTYDKHLQKALHHLDTILTWFSSKYPGNEFASLAINCPALTKNLPHFSKLV